MLGLSWPWIESPNPMKIISSRRTFLLKFIAPVLWFGFLADFGAQAILARDGRPVWPVLIFLGVLAVIGLWQMKWRLWDLVDEVADAGDFLVVRKGDTEVSIPLADIAELSSRRRFANPRRVSLRLIKPCSLGSVIVFAPEAQRAFLPFKPNAVLLDLKARIEGARALT